MTTDNFLFICKTDESKAVKQEVNGTVIRPPLVFPDTTIQQSTNDLQGNDVEPTGSTYKTSNMFKP